MLSVFWIVFAFLCGSLPLSLWLGRYALGVDIRDYGDGNPGATNVYRAGGAGWGVLAILLDSLKGAIPVGIAHFGMGLQGWQMTFTAVAPVAGHVFSPFLGGRGGKALATTFGIWAGLTIGEGPIILGLFLGLWEFVLDNEGWAVLLGMLGLLAHLLLNHPAPLLIAVWFGNFALLVWTHRSELRKPPRLRYVRGKTRSAID
jgi:glycerol-3-phosphate acyltransferase PlsY